MAKSQLTAQQYFQQLKILFYALVTGPLLFAGVALFLNQQPDKAFSLGDMTQILMVVILVVMIGGVFASNFLFKRKMEVLKASKVSLSQKCADYRAASILSYALIEGPTLFTFVAYLLTGDMLFLAMGVLAMGVFLSKKPSKEKAIEDMGLNVNEARQLANDNTIIG